MLRVRPIVFTSRPEDHASLLTALGLACTENHGDWLVFDSGDGKVGLHRAAAGSAEDGTVQLGFEIRDRGIFVRRTLADGTLAELLEAGRGPAARVTAPDGFSFLADPVADLAPRRPGPLSVVQQWHTPDVAAARKVLADIGARPGPPDADGRSPFRARNGGLVEVRHGEVSGVALALAYDGGPADLGALLAAAGVPATACGGGFAVQAPGGTVLHVGAAGGA
jgi:hypothetical protein